MKRALIIFFSLAAALTLLSTLRAEALPQAASAPAPATLLTQADAIFKQMSQITGLPIRAPLKKQVAGKADIRNLLEENLRSDYAPGELHAEEAALKAFGLVPRDFDLKKFLISFYTEQAAGFYDPERKTMFIAAWVDPSMQKIVLAHELTHALQDQNFGLQSFMREVRQNDDATDARSAVVEGYATAAMMQSMLPSVPIASLPSLESFMNLAIQQDPKQYPVFFYAPFFFKFQALFPYSRGLDFVQQILREKGWSGLNKLFAHPPVNTKQVFDPKIYLASEPQPGIALPKPPALSEGFTFLTENTLGEEGYYSLLGQLASEDKAKALCPSWVADDYLVYATPAPDVYALVSRVRWSNPQAAAQFFDEYQSILGKKYTSLTKDKRPGADLLVASTEHGSVILMKNGSEVRWIEGAPQSQISSLIEWLRAL